MINGDSYVTTSFGFIHCLSEEHGAPISVILISLVKEIDQGKKRRWMKYDALQVLLC